MAKNKASVQSLFQEEFPVVKESAPVKPAPKKADPAPKRAERSKPASEEKPASRVIPKSTAAAKETAAEAVSAEEPAIKQAESAEAHAYKQAASAEKPGKTAMSAAEKAEYRSSSIYLSGENVNFIKYITRERRVSQKQYINDLLKEKQAQIEKEHPLVTGKKIIDFKQPVRAKYRSNKENRTIYSISAPKSLLEYFDRVCERDNITFSTMMDEMISEQREAFLREQE